jgi:hypothetical protein
MYHAVITTKGRAWLLEPEDTLIHKALAVLDTPYVQGEDPGSVFRAFCQRYRALVDPNLSTGKLYVLWQEITNKNGLIKVREPLEPGTPVCYIVDDPPVEYYLKHK